jgi:uroporphyrin-III C-methyltransferase
VTVFLVGAGPGDPGLVTVRGLELIRGCDVLVYDVLVAPELVEEAPVDALVIPREKLRQAELNDLLVELGQSGLDVVRLKGGDPFIFGRGGEEAEALVDAGIAYEVVPGVSALSAVPASAGIPVTHRGVSAQVTLVSGHSASGEDLDYAQLAGTPGTIVIFMGLAHLSGIAGGLVAAGKSRHTPAAVIARGTHADSRSVSGELWDIARLAADLPSPALLVIGDVVAVAPRLAQRPEHVAGDVDGDSLAATAELR